jgi:hypothetical protein
MRCDLASEWNDLVNGCSDDNEASSEHGSFRGCGDRIAPKLVGEGEASFSAAGPDYDTLSEVAGASGSGDGGAE